MSRILPQLRRAADASATPGAKDQALGRADDKIFRKRIEKLQAPA